MFVDFGFGVLNEFTMVDPYQMAIFFGTLKLSHWGEMLLERFAFRLASAIFGWSKIDWKKAGGKPLKRRAGFQRPLLKRFSQGRTKLWGSCLWKDVQQLRCQRSLLPQCIWVVMLFMVSIVHPGIIIPRISKRHILVPAGADTRYLGLPSSGFRWTDAGLALHCQERLVWPHQTSRLPACLWPMLQRHTEQWYIEDSCLPKRTAVNQRLPIG